MEYVRIQIYIYGVYGIVILQMNGIKLKCLNDVGGKRIFFNPKGNPMNQYVDRDNRRCSEKNDGYFTIEFNGSQWDMIKHLNKKEIK